GLTLEASAQGATSNVSAPFDVTPAAATGFAFRAPVAHGTVRSTLAAPAGIVVDLVDTYGNRGARVDRELSVRSQLEGGAAGAVLEGTATQVVAVGESVVAFSDLSIDAEGTTYALRVEELTPPASGALDPATSNTFEIVDDVEPAIPGSLVTGNAAQTSIALTWTAPGDDELLGDITGYELRYATTMLVTEQDFLAATEVVPGPQAASVGAMQSFVVTGLQPDTLYFIGLRAKDGAGNGSMLALTSGSTLPDGCAPVNPCSAPPAATCVGNTAVTHAATATCSPTAQSPWFECAPYETTETVCEGATPFCVNGACAASLCPANIDDADACTVDACDPATGAVTHVAVSVDDSDACTADACNPSTGVSHTPVATDDGVACTVDSCDPVSGVSHTPNHGACAQGEICSATAGCVPSSDPCAAVTCTPSAPGCSADHLSVVTYASTCEPTTAQCVVTSTETLCTDGVCVAGACVTARAPTAADLLITEVMHSPTGTNTEYFELYNLSGDRLNLAGVTVSLGQGNASFTLPTAPLLVDAHAFVVFASNLDATTNGGVTAKVELPAGFTLEASAQLELSLDGTTLTGLNWTTGFPQTPGRSMNLSSAVFAAGANSRSWYWCDSSAQVTGGDFGTPGAANDACGMPAALTVGYCAIQWPKTTNWAGDNLNVTLPVSQAVYTQFWGDQLTHRNTSGNDFYPFVQAEFGYGTSADVAQWTWSDTDWNHAFGTSGNNDERQGTFAPTAPGTYSYGFRYRTLDTATNTWSNWVYCDESSIADLTGTPTWGTVTVLPGAAPTATVTAVNYPVIAHGAALTITGTGFTGVTAVSVGGVAQTFTVTSDTEVVIAALDGATPTGTQALVVGNSAGFNVTVIHLVINELDADSPGNDVAEFVEISAGVPNVSLAGYSVVLWNGSGDTSYLELPLSMTNAAGLIVVGSAGLASDPTLQLASNGIQNGQDAAALYQAPVGAIPNGTPLASAPVPLDVLVYDSADPDDPELLSLLGPAGASERVQINEGDTAAAREAVSIARCGPAAKDGRVFVLAAPTPGTANSCGP
ncbi:MAG: lamin tail domain-containing protein, partial [Myxococcaceae bacterium]